LPFFYFAYKGILTVSSKRGREIMEAITAHSHFQAKDGSSIILRPVKKEDATSVVEAVQSIVSAGNFIQKENVRTIKQEEELITEMQTRKNLYTAILRNERIVGIVRVVRGDLDMKKHTGVFRTWLINEAQGLGIGHAIMKHTLAWGNESGLHKIWLTVFKSNEGAYHLYKKYGFVEEGVQKGQLCIDGVLDDEIYMGYFFLRRC
jgi:RimJ/RimL family protein N-acetyltransferase